MARHEVAGVLDANASLETGLKEVSHNPRHADDESTEKGKRHLKPRDTQMTTEAMMPP